MSTRAASDDVTAYGIYLSEDELRTLAHGVVVPPRLQRLSKTLLAWVDGVTGTLDTARAALKPRASG